jgi:hypothetical protein
MVKDSLSAVGDYEQLTGGVETLFKDSADIVMGYAENAYKTAGLSANQYMETVTSFSASLLQGLNGDTAEAAKIADLAITDMADNANKMGTSMQSIQDAYQGFAKGQYQLLDNLKLGYGGTATEMVRLINDANKVDSTILGVGETIKSLDGITFDQIIQSIHVIQTEMDITGTTAKEASETIQGSMTAAKAAWDNFLSGAGDVDQFVDAFGTALDNIVKNLREIVPRLAKGLVEIVDKVSPLIPDVISELLPVVVNALIRLASDIAKAMPKILASVGKAVVQNIDSLLKMAWVPLLAFSNKLLPLFKNLFGGIGSAITDGIGYIKHFGGSADSIKAAFGGVGEAAKDSLGHIKNFFGGFGGYAIAVGALAAISAGLVEIVTVHMKDVIKANEDHKKVVDDLRQSYEDLQTSTQNNLDVSLTELDNCEKLVDELQNITDANGRVKEGYEARADFILSTLNNALGTEITMTDGVIDNYDELTSSIYDTIEAKRIDATVSVYEETYQEQIKLQTEAHQALTDAIRIEMETREAAGTSISNYEQDAIDAAHATVEAAQQAADDIDAAVANTEETLTLAYQGNIEEAKNHATLYGQVEQEMTNMTEEQCLARIDNLKATQDQMLLYYEASGNEQYKVLADSYGEQLAAAEDYYMRFYGKTVDGMNKSKSAVQTGMNETKAIAQQGGNEIGANMGTGMESGINVMKAKVAAAATRMAIEAKRAAMAELEVASPSKVFKRIGANVAEGMALGIEDDTKKPVTAVKDMTSAMTLNNIVYPDFKRISNSYSNNNTITIAKLADSIVVREDADIDRISNALYRKMQHYNRSRGVM